MRKLSGICLVLLTTKRRYFCSRHLAQLYQQWFSSGKSVIQKLNERLQVRMAQRMQWILPSQQLAQTNKNIHSCTAAIWQSTSYNWRSSSCQLENLTIGYSKSTPDNIQTLLVDPSSQMITGELRIVRLVRFTVRGSEQTQIGIHWRTSQVWKQCKVTCCKMLDHIKVAVVRG